MKKTIRNTCLAVFLSTSLGACAAFTPVTLASGESEQAVLAKLGKPTGRFDDGADHLLEYARAPFGQQTYMARIGPDGKLISYEQVLTSQKFALIKPAITRKEEVLRIIGGPTETSFLSLPQLEVWSYRYKESGAWNSLMHVHFNKAGVVEKLMNGPDPLYEPDERFPLGRSRD